MKAKFTLYTLVLFGILISCKTTTSDPPAPVGELREFSGTTKLRESYSVGCSGMMEHYCQDLYSPESMGNLRIGKTGQSFSIYHGMTKNNFPVTYYFYSTAKIQRKSRFPKDFRQALEEQNYFALLKKYIERPPLQQMTPDERVRDLRLNSQIGSIWKTAFEETLYRRLIKKNPQYQGLSEELIPIEQRWEKRALRRNLISEISLAIWQDDKNWKAVEQSFSKIRFHMLQLISELPLEDEVRTRWEDQILNVKLVAPGSLPEIADEECFSTESNAYYFSHYNLLTVCAGDFNSEDIYQTLAHELAHALDIESMSYRYKKSSNLGNALAYLRKRSCGGGPNLDCKDWVKFRSNFTKLLDEWDDFEIDLPQFQRCLKRQKTPEGIDNSILTLAAQEESAEIFAGLANENAFIRLTAKMIPLVNGTWSENKNYLDICNSKYWKESRDVFDAEESALLFFVHEYRCSDKPASDKLKAAIETAKDMITKVTTKSLQMTQDFSDNSYLVRNGLSSSPNERFADLMGSYALAKLLKEIPDLWTRRKLYLASSSWQCTKPSLSGEFPEESKVERELMFGSYQSDKDRQRESFSRPIRGVLECTKDFQYNECSLY